MCSGAVLQVMLGIGQEWHHMAWPVSLQAQLPRQPEEHLLWHLPLLPGGPKFRGRCPRCLWVAMQGCLTVLRYCHTQLLCQFPQLLYHFPQLFSQSSQLLYQFPQLLCQSPQLLCQFPQPLCQSPQLFSQSLQLLCQSPQRLFYSPCALLAQQRCLKA